MPLTWEETDSGVYCRFSYLTVFFSVEPEGVFKVGWDILPNAINAALSTGLEILEVLGQHLLEVVVVVMCV